MVMGDVLGIGLSHYPPLSGRDDDMAALDAILELPPGRCTLKALGG